jgi:hypothetical protein
MTVSDERYTILHALFLPMWKFIVWMLIVAFRVLSFLFVARPRRNSPLLEKLGVFIYAPPGLEPLNRHSVRAPPFSPSPLRP